MVLASPGMLQSGFSRMLFDRWCEDPRNGVVLAGYSVEGTLARRLESNPSEVESLQNRRLIRRIGVERVSFSGAWMASAGDAGACRLLTTHSFTLTFQTTA